MLSGRLFICFVVALALPFVFSACDQPDAFNLAARYHGIETRGDASARQVTAFGSGSAGKDFQLEVFETLATAKSQSLRLRFENETTAWLAAEALGQGEKSLSVSGACATGTDANQSIRLCWSKASLDLTVSETSSGRTTYALKIENSEKSILPATTPVLETGYSLNELIGRARFFNYSVAQEAQRVYQAKKRVSAAAAGLLPSLNIKAPATFFLMGPTTAILEGIGGLVPFLLPSNWYKWEQSKAMYEAEKLSFAAMRANEMNGVHGMAYALAREAKILTLARDYIDWLRQVREIVVRAEHLGRLPTGSTGRVDLTITKMAQDRQQLRNMYEIERGAMAHAIALPPIESDAVGLAEVQLPDLSGAGEISPKAFVSEARSRSLETRVLDHLIKASEAGASEVTFAFLDPMAGIDIGFRYPQLIKIAKSEIEELKIKQRETLSIIDQRCVELAAELNGAIASYKLADFGRRTAKLEVDRMLRGISLGEPVYGQIESVVRFVDMIEEQYKFDVDSLNATYAYLVASSKLDRLLLSGYYADAEAGIPLKP